MIRHDHFLHMAVSFVLAVAGTFFLGRTWGLILALAIGAAKEWLDWRVGRGTPEWSDMAANVVGIAAAWAVIALLGV